MLLPLTFLTLLHFTLASEPKVNATISSKFSDLQPEVEQREDLDYTGFVFNLGNPAQVYYPVPLLCTYSCMQQSKKECKQMLVPFKIGSWGRVHS